MESSYSLFPANASQMAFENSLYEEEVCADQTKKNDSDTIICSLCLESKTCPISCWNCGDSYCSVECAEKDGDFHKVDGKTIYACSFCKEVNIEGHCKFDCIFCQ